MKFTFDTSSTPALSQPGKSWSKTRRNALLSGAVIALAGISCANAATYTGAVYAGTNDAAGNTVAAFGKNADGTLTPIAEYATGGAGGIFDAGEGLDPLISEDSIVNVDNRFLLVVNAGSDTVSSLRINPDFSLTLISTAPTGGVGPNSIAYSNGLVYVSNVDSDGVFTGPPDQSGNVTGLRLDPSTGELTAIAGSTRELGNRPSDVEFSTDGQHIVVSSWNAQSTALPAGGPNELVSFGVLGDGNLSASTQGNVASTPTGNPANRNLPAAIGFEIVEVEGKQIIVATEAREFLASGDPAMLAEFQTGSVSSWELNSDGSLTAISQDVLTGASIADGPTSACWIVATPDGRMLFVASASGATISSFRLDANGSVSLIESIAAAGTPADPSAPNPVANADGFIDLALSSDGKYLYQLLGLEGTVNVYIVGADGGLSLLQQVTGLLPEINIQGIVFATAQEVPLPAAGLLWLAGLAGLGAIRKRRTVLA